jgi:hypothetical protein
MPNGSRLDTALPAGQTGATKSITVTATDGVGRKTTVTRSYTVWAWSGFFAPVNNPPTVNTVNAGRAIPVKFSLGGNRGLSIFETGYPKSQAVPCDSTAPVDGIETTVTADSSGLIFDSGANQYNYVWKTSSTWAGTCRQLVLKFPSGSFRRAFFKFK